MIRKYNDLHTLATAGIYTREFSEQDIAQALGVRARALGVRLSNGTAQKCAQLMINDGLLVELRDSFGTKLYSLTPEGSHQAYMAISEELARVQAEKETLQILNEELESNDEEGIDTCEELASIASDLEDKNEAMKKELARVQAENQRLWRAVREVQIAASLTW